MSDRVVADNDQAVILCVPRHPRIRDLYCQTPDGHAEVALFPESQQMEDFWEQVVVPSTTEEPGRDYRFERVVNLGGVGSGWTAGSYRYAESRIEHEAFKLFPGGAPLANRFVGLPGDRVVAFVDILGFRDAVRRMFADDAVLFEEFRSTLHSILREEDFIQAPVIRAFKNVEMTAFSDSVVLSSEGSGADVSVVQQTLHLCAELLKAGVLTRGGISSGITYHQGRVVFGLGVNRAYELETRVAHYPRVVVDEHIALRLQEGPASALLGVTRAPDGCWYLGPFSDLTFWEFDTTKATDRGLFGLGAFTGRANPRSFEAVRDGLLKGLSDTASRPERAAKWSWLISEFNRTIANRRGLESIEPVLLAGS